MFERPQGGERAALIQVDIGVRRSSAVFEEFRLLAQSAGAEVLWENLFYRDEVEPRYYLGCGQAERIAEAVQAHRLELVIFNAPLSPAQERNLERLLQARVLDRSALVLDIFAQRAQSHEGKLQVELAQLKHLSTRLVRGWTHLERQKGGIGLRGPGETQLETDRRLLGMRIKQLQKRLEKVRRVRAQSRQSRRELPTVALAGYTNSGKSTLFNALTQAETYAANRLFATLDPSWRKLVHDGPQTILLADTVGFVSDLPHELVEAFRATLEESAHADLILEVLDVSDEEREAREAVVAEVLDTIQAGEVPRIRVFNKIDLSGAEPVCQYDANGAVVGVSCSAKTGAGLALLREAIVAHFRGAQICGWLHLDVSEARLRAALHQKKVVLTEEIEADGSQWFQLCLNARQLGELSALAERDLPILSQKVFTK